MAGQLRQFLRLKQVAQRVGYQRSTIYTKIQSGEFPKPYPLSENGRAVAWSSDDIDSWISARIAARDKQARP